MSKSQSVLYHDCQVYDYDLDTLRPAEWLNDTIIEFCFEYFEREVFVQQNRFLFLRPAMVFLMMHTRDRTGLESALPPKLNEKDIIFLPINDSDGQDQGTHWSLLIYWKQQDTFYHYDSVGYCNEMMARYCKDRIAELVGSSMNAPFVSIDTPQQHNGFDCGVYVIAITNLIASRLVHGGFDLMEKPSTESLFQINTCITDTLILETRKKFFTLITKLLYKK